MISRARHHRVSSVGDISCQPGLGAFRASPWHPAAWGSSKWAETLGVDGIRICQLLAEPAPEALLRRSWAVLTDAGLAR